MKRFINKLKRKIKIKVFNWATKFIRDNQYNAGYPNDYITINSDKIVVLSERQICNEPNNLDIHINVIKGRLAKEIMDKHIFVYASVSEGNPNNIFIDTRITIIKN